MPIDTSLPAGKWFGTLLKRLNAEQDDLNMLDRYYRGEANLPESATQHRDSYRHFQRKSRTNWAELVVDAPRERMRPIGFRTGAAGDELGDDEAWKIWQANSLDADVPLLFTAMMSMRRAAVIVGEIDEETGQPLITIEDPREIITAQDPARRRRTNAALKVFRDEDADVDRAYLYLPSTSTGGAPGFVLKASRKRSGGRSPTSGTAQSWNWDGDPQPLKVRMPVVPFFNRPAVSGPPTAEFEGAIDVIDRINHMVLQRVIIATFQAFRQRAIKGLPRVDAQGNEIDYSDLFIAGAGALWQLPDNADMWESAQSDMQGIHQAVRDDVQDLAATTRTPLFYLTPDAANGSAEGASLAREGLVFKAIDRIGQATEQLERVMSLAFEMKDDTKRAAMADLEVLWASPEIYSLAERADAASKLVTVGVPFRDLMQLVMQVTPQQVARMETNRAADSINAALRQPQQLAPTTTGVPAA